MPHPSGGAFSMGEFLRTRDSNRRFVDVPRRKESTQYLLFKRTKKSAILRTISSQEVTSLLIVLLHLNIFANFLAVFRLSVATIELIETDLDELELDSLLIF